MHSASRFVLVALMASALVGCGLGTTPDLGTLLFPVSAYCTAQVDGVGAVDVENDYLPHVVACENGSADFEALKAQAVSARSVLYHSMATHGHIGDGTHAQVYSCNRPPSQVHYDAVAATSGQVLVYNDNVIYAFYVAGAIPGSSSCVAGPGDSDPTSTEHWVTYNWDNSGSGVTQTPLGWVSPSNWANRGCMSQNGSNCLSLAGWSHPDIARFYYGMDIQVRTAEGACVDPDDNGDPNQDDPPQDGNGEIKGVVFVDQGVGTSDMSMRLPEATVFIEGVGSLSVRAGDAFFSLELPAGSYSLTASAPGYLEGSRTCSVTGGAEIWCSVGLTPSGGGGDEVGGDDDVGGGDEVGGDDDVGGGDDGDGQHGGFDFDAPKGLVTGYVLAATEDLDAENCTGPTVPGAEVRAETGEVTEADENGYFEFQVVPGNHLLGASAEDFFDGAAECRVISDESVFCCIPVVPGQNAELGPWHHQDDPDAVGCATAGPSTGLALLPLLALLVLTRCRRR